MYPTKPLKNSDAPRKPWLKAGIVASLALLLVAPMLPTASASLGETGCFAMKATDKGTKQFGLAHGPGCDPIADGEGGSVVVPTPTPTPTPTPEEVCTPESRQKEADDLTTKLTAAAASASVRDAVLAEAAEIHRTNYDSETQRAKDTTITRLGAQATVSPTAPCAEPLRITYSGQLRFFFDWRASATGNWAVGAHQDNIIKVDATGDASKGGGVNYFRPPYVVGTQDHPWVRGVVDYGNKTFTIKIAEAYISAMDAELARQS